MKELNFPTNENGVCFGLALMAERARRCGEYHKFKKRMDYLEYISTLKKGSLESRIQAAQKISSDSLLTSRQQEEREMLLEIKIFFFQVYAHFNPQFIQTHLDIQPTLEQAVPRLSQKDFQKAETLMFQDSPLPAPHSYFLSETPENKESFVRQFLETIQQSNEPVGLLIDSSWHAIHVFYDIQQKKWFLTNHSELKEYKSVNELLPKLINIFAKNKVASLNFGVFTENFSPNTNILLKKLKTISDASVETVCSSGKKINQQDSSGVTSLHIAAQNGHVEIVKALLEKNANVNLVNSKGLSALSLAADNGHVAIVKALLEKNAAVNTSSGYSPLLMAAQNGHLEIVKALLEKNANVNDSIKGLTPLYVAAKNGYSEIVKALLKKNANVNLTNLKCKSPLWIAAENGHLDIVKILLEGNQKCEIDNSLLCDLGKHQVKVIEILLENGFTLLDLIKDNLFAVENLLEFWKKQANDKNRVSNLQSTPSISDELKQDIISYAETKINTTIFQCKKSFFIEIISLIANNRLTLDNLFNTLVKYKGTELFYKHEGFSFSEKSSVTSKSAKLVAALFSDIGLKINSEQLKNIVEGNINQIQLINSESKKIEPENAVSIKIISPFPQDNETNNSKRVLPSVSANSVSFQYSNNQSENKTDLQETVDKYRVKKQSSNF